MSPLAFGPASHCVMVGPSLPPWLGISRCGLFTNVERLAAYLPEVITRAIVS